MSAPPPEELSMIEWEVALGKLTRAYLRGEITYQQLRDVERRYEERMRRAGSERP